MHCTRCGTPLDDKARFCPSCGQRVDPGGVMDFRLPEQEAEPPRQPGPGASRAEPGARPGGPGAGQPGPGAFRPESGVEQGAEPGAEQGAEPGGPGAFRPEPGAYPGAYPGVRYASWSRLAAYLVDVLCASVAVIAVLALVSGGGGASDALAVLLPNVALWLYFALQESSRFQATPGKRLMGLKVTDLEGRRISFGRATGRYFAKMLSGMLLMLGYAMILFTKKRQGLHDLLAGTLVVYR